MTAGRKVRQLRPAGDENCPRLPQPDRRPSILTKFQQGPQLGVPGFRLGSCHGASQKRVATFEWAAGAESCA